MPKRIPALLHIRRRIGGLSDPLPTLWRRSATRQPRCRLRACYGRGIPQIPNGCRLVAHGGPVASGGSPNARRSAPVTGHTPPTSGAPAMGDSTGLVIKVGWLASGDCAHEWEAAGYQPPPRLRHLIEIRDQTCSFPGCRRPVTRCDLDHTIPYARGGELVSAISRRFVEPITRSNRQPAGG